MFWHCCFVYLCSIIHLEVCIEFIMENTSIKITNGISKLSSPQIDSSDVKDIALRNTVESIGRTRWWENNQGYSFQVYGAEGSWFHVDMDSDHKVSIFMGNVPYKNDCKSFYDATQITNYQALLRAIAKPTAEEIIKALHDIDGVAEENWKVNLSAFVQSHSDKFLNSGKVELGIFWMDDACSEVIHSKTILERCVDKNDLTTYSFQHYNEWQSRPEGLPGSYKDYPRDRIYYQNGEYIVETSFFLNPQIETYLCEYFTLPNDAKFKQGAW
jgi:hypothetical protein